MRQRRGTGDDRAGGGGAAGLQREGGVEQALVVAVAAHQRVLQSELRKRIHHGGEGGGHGKQAEIGRHENTRQNQRADEAKAARNHPPTQQPCRANNGFGAKRVHGIGNRLISQCPAPAEKSCNAPLWRKLPAQAGSVRFGACLGEIGLKR